MAVAILEKSIEALQKNEDSRVIKLNRVYDANAISDEQHNAKIAETHARLINPNASYQRKSKAVSGEDKRPKNPFLSFFFCPTFSSF